MSQPVTMAERIQAQLTTNAAGASENLVSTACPECHVRFTLLARYTPDGTQRRWMLRCTRCFWKGTGELK